MTENKNSIGLGKLNYPAAQRTMRILTPEEMREISKEQGFGRQQDRKMIRDNHFIVYNIRGTEKLLNKFMFENKLK